MNDPPRRQIRASVHQNIPLCRDHFKLVLRVPEFAPTFPGQFIQILCCEPEESAIENATSRWRLARVPFELSEGEAPSPCGEFTQARAFLRRPFSLAGRRDTPAGVELDIIHRVVGVGTSWLSNLQIDDVVDVLGPLGNRFTLPDGKHTAILVAGGVGIPPMLYLATHLSGNAIAFCGATTVDLLPLALNRQAADGADDPAAPSFLVEEFARCGTKSVISTDDGSVGLHGLVTEALERYLNSPLAPDPSPLLYTCGPEPMMKRVAQMAIERGIECQVAVERAMACGMGTCQSCCIRARKPDRAKPPLVGSDWCYRLACTDGPIFKAADLLW